MFQAVPYITEFDPVYTSEGSLDPLGLYPIADRLATRLVPGVRERMLHPRFLTAMAVGSVICSEFDTERIAADGISEPWMIYEWYVVQAMVRTFDSGRTAIPGVPGTEKATTAYRSAVPLNASRYLKTATVFGFHGVYRTLADEIGVVDRTRQLGEVGDQLVRAWEKEQKLYGFYTSYTGPGRHFREKIFRAVDDGLRKGEVARSWHWPFLNEIGERLAYQDGGRKELDIIYNALRGDAGILRSEVIGFLMTPAGQEAWMRNKSEKEFHEALLERASRDLKDQLHAILSYEKFSRLLQNAFESCLYSMSVTGSETASRMATLSPVTKAAENIRHAFEEAYHRLEPVGEALRFHAEFERLAGHSNAVEWVHLLFQHHQNNQRRKPPTGKRPWAARSSGEHYLLYSRYQMKKAPELSGEYVSFYRTNSLYSFLKDLKKIENG